MDLILPYMIWSAEIAVNNQLVELRQLSLAFRFGINVSRIYFTRGELFASQLFDHTCRDKDLA